MKSKKYKIGDKFSILDNYMAEIVDILGYGRVNIRIIGFDYFKLNVHIGNLKNGKIKNPYHPSVHGVGYLGIGSVDKKVSNIWNHIISRGYGDNVLEKRPSYKNVTVCDEWHCRKTFSDWYMDTFPNIPNVKFQIDKDLLQRGVENKVYSEKTCVWLPIAINTYISKPKDSGVFWYERKHKWMGYVHSFREYKRIHLGYFKTKEECEAVVRKAKMEQDEKAKDYLRSLNYLPEEIIQLIRTV